MFFLSFRLLFFIQNRDGPRVSYELVFRSFHFSFSPLEIYIFNTYVNKILHIVHGQETTRSDASYSLPTGYEMHARN